MTNKYEKIKQKENIGERNQEINKLLKETKELHDSSIQNSDEFKKLLEDKRELFLNDSVYSEALNNELEDISNLLKFNTDEGIKKIELMEKEGKLNAMKIQEIYEKAGISYSANEAGVDAKKKDVKAVAKTDAENTIGYSGGSSKFNTISDIEKVEKYYIGGAAKIEVDKRQSGNMNFNQEEIYELTHYIVEVIWNVYVILKMLVGKNTLIKKFMTKYIKSFFNKLNSKKINTIVSGIDTYKGIAEILINEVFLEIISKITKNNHKKFDILKETFIKKYSEGEGSEGEGSEDKGSDGKYVEDKGSDGKDDEDKTDNKKNAFIKIAFKQTELINFLINKLDEVPELGESIMKKGGIDKIKVNYTNELEKILGIVDDKKDQEENFRCINNELNSIFKSNDYNGKNFLTHYREKINKIDNYIDKLEIFNLNKITEYITTNFINGFKLDSSGIIFNTSEFKNEGSLLSEDRKQELEKRLKKLETEKAAIESELPTQTGSE